MTGQQRDAGLPRGPCVPTRVHRLRYAWLAALGFLLLVVTAAVEHGRPALRPPSGAPSTS